MKLLFENWRKFLNERMEFGEGFEKWRHGEIPEEYDDRMDVDEDEFGQGADCKAAELHPSCLMEYGFDKVGEGTFREVWELPDNPNYVMKIAGRGMGTPKEERAMNKLEADTLVQTGYPELLPKVYDRADDYSWIVVEAVKPYKWNDDSWIKHFFSIFKKFQEMNRKNKDFAWRNSNPERFFQEYTQSRMSEIRKSDDENSVLTQDLGGDVAREEFEAQLPSLYHRLLELMEQYDLTPSEIRGDNVGRGTDGRFVILDLGWAMGKKK